jgi:hypothetical protein
LDSLIVVVEVIVSTSTAAALSGIGRVIGSPVLWVHVVETLHPHQPQHVLVGLAVLIVWVWIRLATVEVVLVFVVGLVTSDTNVDGRTEPDMLRSISSSTLEDGGAIIEV